MEWYVFALISALFSATAAIFEKKTLFKEGALEFSTILGFFNIFLSATFFFFVDYGKVIPLAVGVLFFKAILGALAFLCVMYGIKNLELSGALPLLVLTPGLVAFIAFIVLGSALTKFEILGMGLLLIGTYILQIGDKKSLFEPFKVFIRSKGHNFIIAALLLFTTTSILDKVLLGKFKLPPNAFMGFQHLFLGIVFLILFFFIYRRTPGDFTFSLKRSGWLIFLVACLTMVYRYSQILAVKLGSVALVLSLKRISVFFATVIGGKIFKEHNLFRKGVATALMVCGAIMVILGNKVMMLLS